MRGLVFNAPGDVSVENVADPSIMEPGDVIVRVTKAGICGSDMHIWNHGDAFGFSPGCRLGHEFVGVVEEVGPEVTRFRPGQKVASPFWISCGHCHFCRKGLFTSCVAGGCYGFQAFWPGGGDVQGGQSEYVRVPMADGTLEPVPEALAGDANDSRVLPLTDVFTTAYHAVRGAEVRPGDRVVVVGDGAVGLLACHAARLRDPAAVILLGHHDDRLEVGRRLGATHTVNTGQADPADLVAEVTDGVGPEAVIDAVSSADSMVYATNTVQPGGTVSWVGMEVFLAAPQVPWDVCFLRNITIRGGVAPVRRYLTELWPLLEEGRIDPSPVLTHDLSLEEAAAGYPIMARREEGSVKVAITPGRGR
jgi:threonine dehydrogenase-like Zn-dependent dehydrogenase